MIARLQGTIQYISPSLKKDSHVIIDVGGVGYKVQIPSTALASLTEQQDAILHTYMSVSEYAMNLYGFLNAGDKSFFEMLLDVPGVGPKSAVGILEKVTLSDVQQAIVDNDPEVLTKVSGLGKKTAEKIIVALKDKLDLDSEALRKSGSGRSTDVDVFDALVGFGYSAAEAKAALDKISPDADTSDKLKQALQLLAKK